MIPNLLYQLLVRNRAPRVSGDDPYPYGVEVTCDGCSPRERG